VSGTISFAYLAAKFHGLTEMTAILEKVLSSTEEVDFEQLK